MPTVAVNDLVVHPRDNDLILGTHGRGIWILDNMNALQEMGREVLSSSVHVFSTEPAEQIRYRSEKGHTGNMIFHGDNPDPGAVIDFWMADEAEVSLSILNPERLTIASVPTRGGRGINRSIWNLRYTDPEQSENGAPRGPLVVPGTYIVRLESNGTVSETTLEVREDPRIQVDPETRRLWTEELLALNALAAEAGRGTEEMRELAEKVEADPSFREALSSWSTDLLRQWNELRSRTGSLVREVEGWVGPLTADQASRRAYYEEMVETLGREGQALVRRVGGGRDEGNQR